MYRQLSILSFLLFFNSTLLAQPAALTAQELTAYQQEATQLLNYVQGTLNFLGNPNEVVADKDIIINESYLKIFQNPETQIEDDLDASRKTPLNKDVQAYLKDVMFFYKQVYFTFDIVAIEQQINQNDQVYFKITTNRTLSGISVSGDTLMNNKVRYFEVNLDQQKKELKIASIYTTKLNKKEELRNWWNTMAPEWKQVFGRSVLVFDTLPFMDIIGFTDSTLVTSRWEESICMDTLYSIDSTSLVVQDTINFIPDTLMVQTLDTVPVNPATLYRVLKAFQSQQKLSVTHNHIINSLSPLAALNELQELDISYTLVTDLSPIRNLNKLETLNLEGCPVETLGAIRYLNHLKELNASMTKVSNIEPLAQMNQLFELSLDYTPLVATTPLMQLKNLKQLSLKGIQPNGFDGLTQLNALTDLNLSSSSITNLDIISTLQNLQNLNIDSTLVRQLAPMSRLVGLSILQANSTGITDLTPLLSLTDIRAIYCDNTSINRTSAMMFMDQKPNCLVIYNSENLLNWWNELDNHWQQIFKREYQLNEPLTKEQLHQLIGQQTLSVGSNKQIRSLDPVAMLHRLEELNLQNTAITDLSPLSGLNNLKILNINHTNISTLTPLSNLQNLHDVSANQCQVKDLLPLQNNTNLKTIWCNNTLVTQNQVIAFRKALPSCIVIYQVNRLRTWWNLMDQSWKHTFQEIHALPESPTDFELQQLANSRELEINNNAELHDLTPLTIMIWLTDLSINNTGITQLSPIVELKMLTELQITQNPVTNIDILSRMTQLEKLNLENTPIENLEGIKDLYALTVLDISGTRVKSLKYLASLHNLEILSINNTRIKNLKPLEQLQELRLLKCINTPLKQSKVDAFKRQHLNTEVIYY